MQGHRLEVGRLIGLLILVFIILVATINVVAAGALTLAFIALFLWAALSEPGPRAPARKRSK